MDGLVIDSLRAFMSARDEEETVRSAPRDRGCRAATVDGRTHPLFDVGTRIDGERARFLEEFGAFFVGALARHFGGVVQPHWTTLDLIEHAEQTLLRVAPADARRAGLSFRSVRLHDRAVSLRCLAPRGLCAVARGVITGIAESRGEDVRIEDAACMLHGDAACELIVRRG